MSPQRSPETDAAIMCEAQASGKVVIDESDIAGNDGQFKLTMAAIGAATTQSVATVSLAHEHGIARECHEVICMPRECAYRFCRPLGFRPRFQRLLETEITKHNGLQHDCCNPLILIGEWTGLEPATPTMTRSYAVDLVS